MKASDVSNAPVNPTDEKDSPIAFYLLMGALVAGLILVALMPFLS